MTQPRLPDGFAVQVDRRVQTFAAGSALLGGSPTRLLRLAPAAQNLLDRGRLEVRDATSAQLARALLDATVAHPRPAGGPSYQDVTVVIPVRDNSFGVYRLVMSLRGLRVVVVDDGSATPVQGSDFANARCDVEVIRHPESRGPAAARNTGLAASTTDFVAFLDSDVVPRRGWMESLLGHFCDPTVALVAPRIVGLGHSDELVARYEAVRSSLDLGAREAPVVPYGPVSYVPSAAIICRRTALIGVGGFEESLGAGEDVDLCWRLVEAGFRLRYEPIALVAHEHRTKMRDWLGRRAFYGASAAPLSLRHPDKTAPMVFSAWSLMVWLLMALGSASGYLASLVFAGLSTHRLAKTMRNTDAGARAVFVLALRSIGGAALQLASAICRHYWPVAFVAALMSRRCRRVVLLAAVTEGVLDWIRRNRDPDDDSKPLGLISFLVLRRLDDLAYGTGLWAGVVRERTLRPLKPQIKS
jgi:mycofactocin system glycosyltransferase